MGGRAGGVRRATSVLAVSCLAVSGLSCERSSVLTPFVTVEPRQSEVDAGADAGDEEPLLVADDERPTQPARDRTLGGRCLEDAQCDDGIACTFDACDVELERCRYTPDDSLCQDDSYCNGQEICQPGAGCRPGEIVSCDDQWACTIDRCVEASRECERKPRDVDQDGDPDARCVAEGGDCDDADGAVSSMATEICANQRDDDCDGETDEGDCVRVAHDDCSDPLAVEAAGNYVLSLTAVAADSASTCSAAEARDAVVAIEVPEESDVLVSVTGSLGAFSAALRSECSSRDSELFCQRADPLAEFLTQGSFGRGPTAPGTETAVARMRARSQGPGVLWLWVHSLIPQELEVAVEFAPRTEPPENETCADAAPLEPGQSILVDPVGAAGDLVSRCGGELGELVYEFSLDQAADVRLRASAVERESEPVLSLRSAACEDEADELSCSEREDAELFVRALAAGSYFVAVSADPPSAVNLELQVGAVSPAPAGDRCAESVELRPLEPLQLDLWDHSDDLRLGCLSSGRDAVLHFDLDAPRDVLLKQRTSVGDRGAIALFEQGCEAGLVRACVSGNRSPLRAVRHNVPAGRHAVLVESELGSPTEVLLASRPARPPLLIAGSDACEDAVTLPAEGAQLSGNTTQARPDFSASCDAGGSSSAGAPDQLLKLVLTERSRLILDTAGSSLTTIVNVRRGPECPGTEVPRGCVLGDSAGSYYEDVLDAGTYFVQIDGFAGLDGQWNLEAFVLPEPAR